MESGRRVRVVFDGGWVGHNQFSGEGEWPISIAVKGGWVGRK